MLPSKDVKKGIKSKRMGHNTTPVPGFVRREKSQCRKLDPGYVDGVFDLRKK